MNSLFIVLKVTLAIIGTVIGAGFISGMEILTFFKGSNIVISVIILFVLFFLVFLFFLNLKRLPEHFLISLFEPMLLFGNVIIMSGMISAINDVCIQLFNISEKTYFFSIISLILSIIILSKGINGLMIFNLFLVPFFIIITLFMLLNTSSIKINLFGDVSLINILLYLGVNTFLSIPVFVSLGNKTNFKQSLIVSLLSAFILCFFIFLIFVCLTNASTNVLKASIPTLAHIAKNPLYIKGFSLVVLIGTITTLFSSHYPVIDFSNKFKHKKIMNFIMVTVVFCISLLGFYKIVNYIYPILGFCGLCFTIICFILSIRNFKFKNRQ